MIRNSEFLSVFGHEFIKFVFDCFYVLYFLSIVMPPYYKRLCLPKSKLVYKLNKNLTDSFMQNAKCLQEDP